MTNSEHHTSMLFACSPLQLCPEVWYHMTIEIKVGGQTWIQTLERDTLLSRYRLESSLSYLLMEVCDFCLRKGNLCSDDLGTKKSERGAA